MTSLGRATGRNRAARRREATIHLAGRRTHRSAGSHGVGCPAAVDELAPAGFSVAGSRRDRPGDQIPSCRARAWASCSSPSTSLPSTPCPCSCATKERRGQRHEGRAFGAGALRVAAHPGPGGLGAGCAAARVGDPARRGAARADDHLPGVGDLLRRLLAAGDAVARDPAFTAAHAAATTRGGLRRLRGDPFTRRHLAAVPFSFHAVNSRSFIWRIRESPHVIYD